MSGYPPDTSPKGVQPRLQGSPEAFCYFMAILGIEDSRWLHIYDPLPLALMVIAVS